MSAKKEKILFVSTCGKCKKVSKESSCLPRGWKRHLAQTYCETCWNEKYSMRAISIPVVRPLGEGVSWKDLREALAEAWADSTACANWIGGEMYARDVRRTPDVEKMPAMPKIYLYPEAVKRFPLMPSQAVAGMCQSIGRKYRSNRYEVVWTSGRTNSNHRYPYPAAFPGQAWTPSYQTAGKDGGDMIPCVSVTLRKGKRFTLQLRGGNEFRRQLGDFKLLIDGTADQGEIVFYRQRVGGNENRNGVRDRDSGGQHAQYRVMCKMVGWFPKNASADLTGTLRVKTDVDAMLLAVNEKDEKLWWLNADHLKRWSLEHKRRLHRLAEDSKHEARPDVAFQSLRERACNKFHNRVDSFIKMAVAQLCGLAKRRKFAEIHYDDKVKSCLEDFAWAAMETRLATKCNELNITYVRASGAVSKDNEEGARMEVNQ